MRIDSLNDHEKYLGTQCHKNNKVQALVFRFENISDET